MLTPRFVGACLLAAMPCLAFAQDYDPPQNKAPDSDTLKAIADKTLRLGQALESLRRQGVPDALLVEAQIHHKAAVWIVRHGEFYHPTDAAKTLEVLDRGLLRASHLAQGQSPWLRQNGQVQARAFRSRIDGSVQPYAVSYPEEYGHIPNKKYRLDVELHGRDSSLTEVKFLTQYSGDKQAPKGQAFIHLQVFGRGNNAYRWAGETDVMEAIDAFIATERFLGRDTLVDPARVVLRGFSMGGAGTWHLGLHRPDHWCVIGPGAGFTTTHGYIKNLAAKLAPHQEACLHIYDAVDYAENAFNVPVVAYSGDQDPQMAAAKNIEARIQPLGLSMTHLVAPGLAHRFPPEWRLKAEAEYAKYAQKGREEHPTKIRFVTYTLKYPRCYWVQLLGLDRHYEQARIEAERNETTITAQTKNIRTLRFAATAPAPLTIKIDGQELEAKPWLGRDDSMQVCLERREGTWRVVLPPRLLTDRAQRLRKSPGVQGPIDDAFTTSFLCVRGTGRAWNQAVQAYAEADLQRFQTEWNKFLRGDLPIKDDSDVTEEDIAAKNLILFGDPGSNSLIAAVLDGLPLEWTRGRLKLAGHEYPAADHVPALVYPSPLQAGRYIVLNSGHTFHAADYRGTNALLYPRLGDYAVLNLVPNVRDPTTTAVTTVGLFDDAWSLARP